MWLLTKYLIVSSIIIITTLYTNFNYFYFGILSELLWLCVYTVSSVSGSYLNDITLLTIPFLILTLTAIEAVVFWSMLLWNIKK